jgi:osmotically-inducible protein OsmY
MQWKGQEIMRIWQKLLLMGGLALVMEAWGVSRLRAASGPDASDAAVVQAIEHRFETAPGVPSYLINVTAKNGVVTLSGAVDDMLAKDRAGQLAATIPGVCAVRNQMEVRLSARAPGYICQSIDSVLTAAPALNHDEIQVGIQDGFVTLSGTVDSWPERHLAGLLAEGVPGVRGIDNKLRVAYGIPRSDAGIQADIRSRIRWDAWLNTPELRVDVSHGQVRLTGFVESGLARDHVYQDAWVNGVNSVDVSGVGIVPDVRVAMNHAGQMSGASFTAAGRLSDRELQTAIAQACYYDPLLRPDHITVRVQNGVATLRGAVPNLEAKDAAQQLAREVAGPGRVKDLLQVRPIQTS